MRTRQTCLIVLIPTVCVAVGLWMQYRNGQRAILKSLEQNLWDRIGAVVLVLEREGELPDDAVLSQAVGRMVDRPGELGGVIRVDQTGRVVAQFPNRSATHSLESLSHVALRWHPLEAGSAKSHGPTRGILMLNAVPNYAVRLDDPGEGGAVFVHQPVAVVDAEVSLLTRSFPAIGVVTLIWIAAVLSISVFVVLGRSYDTVDSQRIQSTAESLRQATNLARTQDAVIFGLAKLADSRDSDTGAHLDRISAYATLLASAARQHPSFSHTIDSEFVRLIGISSALHDIGKVGVADDVLLKPGPLTAAERRRMEQHTVIGGDCLRSIEQRLGSSNFLQMAREIALAHHERWDGGGYPAGLAGKAIPLAARIVAIADVYDALSSKRVYKPAFAHEKCVQIIREVAGKQFDPELIEIWLTLEPRFREIAQHSSHDTMASPAPEFTLTSVKEPNGEETAESRDLALVEQ